MNQNSRSINENDQEIINENVEKFSDESNSKQLETFEEEEDLYITESDNSLSEDSMKNEENYLNFLQIVKDGNVDSLNELITKSDINLCILRLKAVLERKDLEGILPLQYAVMFGNIDMIDKLTSLGVNNKILLEGVPLLHLSLSFSSKITIKKVFSAYREKSLNCFKHLFSKIDQSLCCDRLGRSILHYIIMNDLYEILEIHHFDDKLLFSKDFNGDSPIDYLYIYNSINCIKIILNHFNGKYFIYLAENNINFLEKLFV